MFITLVKEYFLPALLVAVIILAIVLLLILVFPKTKKYEYVRENEKAIWSPDLGVFVYHIMDNNYMYSKNGEDWKDLILPGITKKEGDSICYSSILEKFVIILGGSVYNSLDGTTWTEEVIPVSKSEKEKEALEIVELINELRNGEEGNAITIYHDNTDCWDENCHNNCLGTLPKAIVMNACCGHGQLNEAYIQFLNGTIIKGELAVVIMLKLKNKEEKENETNKI